MSFGILLYMEGSRRRRAGRLDAAAALAARALPTALTPWIDQARLDATMILDRATGKAPQPLLNEMEAPAPLGEVDPLSLLPRGMADKLRTAQRDVRILRDRLILGKNPPPLIERPRAAVGAVVSLPRKAPHMARPLKVVKVVHETKDAVSIYVTEADGSALGFRPGQFLSVDVTIDGERLRRAYSLASACLPDVPVHVTVKRIEGGRVSNHLNDTIRKGDELEVLGPSGNFTIEPRQVNERHLVMVAGGSGITPIMSILETALRVERGSRVTLIYGNRGWDDVIFRDRLAALCDEFAGRLVLDHVLEHPPEGWSGGEGLLSGDVLEARLQALGIQDDGLVRYFLCGPTPMMEAAQEALRQRGVDANRIAEERFSSHEARSGDAGSDKTELVVVSKAGHEHGVQVEPGQTILEAALAAGIDMPFSCAMGGCGTCRVRRAEGDIQMQEPNCLSRTEREQGYVLTCVGRPLTQAKINVEGP
ncbi:MAG: 2Fe-2S iron-sulfur cluster binding domain-containing protein [Myxococcales bacterium]|jgi:ring-1,2-phenylacetyl-CoA epoxidase subunit PaaE|nr:2Fe-2S iron-sulfur cluster binding domain-containing protein [Myxococcales bacterium]